jgi:hypothetical protein
MSRYFAYLRLIIRLFNENLKGRDHLRDLDVDGNIILKYILKKEVGMWTRRKDTSGEFL